MTDREIPGGVMLTRKDIIAYVRRGVIIVSNSDTKKLSDMLEPKLFAPESSTTLAQIEPEMNGMVTNNSIMQMKLTTVFFDIIKGFKEISDICDLEISPSGIRLFVEYKKSITHAKLGTTELVPYYCNDGIWTFKVNLQQILDKKAKFNNHYLSIRKQEDYTYRLTFFSKNSDVNVPIKLHKENEVAINVPKEPEYFHCQMHTQTKSIADIFPSVNAKKKGVDKIEFHITDSGLVFNTTANSIIGTFNFPYTKETKVAEFEYIFFEPSELISGSILGSELVNVFKPIHTKKETIIQFPVGSRFIIFKTIISSESFVNIHIPYNVVSNSEFIFLPPVKLDEDDGYTSDGM